MSSIIIKQHDTKITFTDTPTIDGVPVPFGTLSSVSFVMEGTAEDGTQVAIKQAATINGDGSFSYDVQSSDVAKNGAFKQEWEAIYPSGKILTFPNGGYNAVRIIPDLG